ncbi:MAG: hypothetical protein JSW26_24570 [Desulfobacterales bacterium]|nr:MAG: hypothetical protein JSW26_24570 [Desulfobacterales bacterium]
MTRAKGQKFSAKHGSGAQADPTIKAEIEKKAKHGEVACAVAFQIADALEISPADVGKTLDLLELKLNKCQLGLFGYKPAKKAVKTKKPENPQMEEAVRNALVDGRLACRDAWSIARRFNVPKMTVSSACEALGVKIKPCQLGAF